MYFVVNGNNVHTTNVNGNGVYTYNWNYNIYGCIHLSARYMSMCSNQIHYSKPELNKDIISDTGTVKSFSEFGDSSAYLYKFYNYIGYDGNNSIYISNIAGAPGGLFYNIYNNFNISDSEGIYHGNNIANNSVIMGKTSYVESDNGKCLYISLNLTDVGAGAQSCVFNIETGLSTCTSPYKIVTDLQTSGAPSDVDVQLCASNEVGYNVTDTGSKNVKELHDLLSLIGDGFSLLPGVGYAVTAVQATGTAYSLIHCVTNKPVTSNATDNNPAGIKYCISGGSLSGNSCVKNGQNVYASGIQANIKVPNNELNSNFTIMIEYKTIYMCGSSLNTDTRSTTTQTINAVTSSAIYGTVGLTLGCGDGYDPYLNSSLFIENNNTHNFHIVDIRDGYFYFFVKPYTEYKLYYLDKYNNTLEEFKLNNGTTINYIETGSVGSSMLEEIYE